jgi:hypothetical protein
MVPGVGLYLGELFYDTYNMKLEKNQEYEDMKLKEKEESKLNMGTNTIENSITLDNNIVVNNINNNNSISNNRADTIRLSDDPEVNETLNTFTNQIIIPHILNEVI